MVDLGMMCRSQRSCVDDGDNMWMIQGQYVDDGDDVQMTQVQHMSSL